MADASPPDAPGPVRGWVNELILVPLATLAVFAPIAVLVILAGRFVSPRVGPGEPLGSTVLIIGFLGAYAFAAMWARGRHKRLHGRYP